MKPSASATTNAGKRRCKSMLSKRSVILAASILTAAAGTVFIFAPGPHEKTPPTLIVGRIVVPSGVTNLVRAIRFL